LLIEQGLPKDELLLSAVKATFKRRGTHDIPQALEAPPDTLADSYLQLAQDCGVAKKTMAEGFSFLQKYWKRIRKIA
ncbi:MAG: hypothetical protein AABZ27_07965, partial [Candidatus Omnitrophota bacterium]